MKRAAHVGSVFDLQLWSVGTAPWLATDAALPTLAAGASLIELDTVALDGCEGAPAVCFDRGDGFDEAGSVELARTVHSAKPWSALAEVPPGTLRIGVRPCHTAGRLLCSELRVGPIAATGAPRIAAIVHVGTADRWTEMAQYLGHIAPLDRLYVCLPREASREAYRAIAASHPHAVLRGIEPGEDAASASLQLLELASDHGIDLIALLHSRPPPHLGGTDAGRWDMMHKLAGSPEIVADILASFREDPSRGVIGPYGHLLPDLDADGVRPARTSLPGEMFWARLDAIRPLRHLASGESLAHAVTRVAAGRGYRVAETRQPGMGAQTALDFAPAHSLENERADAAPCDANDALALTAFSGLVALDAARGAWQATDNDPQFTVEGLQRHAGGWVCVRFRLKAPFAAELPRLFLDFGSGWTGAAVLARPGPEGRSETICFLPPGLRRVRLDPTNFPGSFELQEPSVEPLPALRAIAAMKRRIAAVPGRSAAGSAAEVYAEYSRALEHADLSYANWIREYEVPRDDYRRLAAIQAQWNDAPTISLVLPEPGAAPAELVQSLLAQVYPHWELWVAADAPQGTDDPRVRTFEADASAGWAARANAALARATGEFCALLERGALLHPLALHYVAAAALGRPGVELVYTDEDRIGADGQRHSPHFKCEPNPELLLAQDMLSRLACYRTARVRALGGVRVGFEGAEPYELSLRFTETLAAGAALHVPRVLHHTRDIAGAHCAAEHANPAHARKAVVEHLERTGASGACVEAAPEAPAMNRVRFAVPSPVPEIAIVIPTRDRADLLSTCIDAIRRLTTYPRYSIVIVDNGSTEPTALALIESCRAAGATVIRDDSPFNFSALNNRAVATLEAEYVCLMNNDVEVVTAGWLEEMVAFAARPGVGAVGARLWFPDRRLQHGGLVLGIAGYAGYAHKLLPAGQVGYVHRAVVHQSFSALTAACLLVRRAIYDEVGGLDEELAVAFNDVDFCLRLRAAGYRNVWTPYAQMIHDESSSRQAESTPEKVRRLQGEMDLLRRRWGASLYADPAYSPNLTLEAEDFSLAWPPRLGLSPIIA